MIRSDIKACTQLKPKTMAVCFMLSEYLRLIGRLVSNVVSDWQSNNYGLERAGSEYSPVRSLASM